MIIALAPSLGPTYGGTVLDLLDWRYNFIFALDRHLWLGRDQKRN